MARDGHVTKYKAMIGYVRKFMKLAGRGLHLLIMAVNSGKLKGFVAYADILNTFLNNCWRRNKTRVVAANDTAPCYLKNDRNLISEKYEFTVYTKPVIELITFTISTIFTLLFHLY